MSFGSRLKGEMVCVCEGKELCIEYKSMIIKNHVSQRSLQSFGASDFWGTRESESRIH